MSIPGLGQIAPTVTPSGTAASSAAPPTETHTLQPFGEYRFEVPHGSTLTVRLVSGTAERDGTELAPNTPYVFSAIKSKINTWHGCTLEVTAPPPTSSSTGSNASSYKAYISEPPSPNDTPMVSYLNLHFKLEGLRSAAAAAAQQQKTGQAYGGHAGTMGPRVMVVGTRGAGKSTLVRTLAGWATRMGRQPLAVSTDPREGVLALPGTLSAAVLATVSDPADNGGGGWAAGVAGTPMSGPSAVPVKLPLAYYYGLASPADNPRLYRGVCAAVAAAVTARLADDPDVRAAGLLIDTPALPEPPPPPGGDNGGGGSDDGQYYDLLTHIASEFSVNIVVVLGSSGGKGERMATEMTRRFAGQKTTLGELVSVVELESSVGAVTAAATAACDAAFTQGVRERAIREYFFGDRKSTLSPFTQQVDFDALSVWRINEAPSSAKTTSTPADAEDADDDDDFYDPGAVISTINNTGSNSNTTSSGNAIPDIERVEPSQLMQNCTLAVVYASPTAMTADAVRDANVMGFVYVADVDEKRRRLRILAPVSARLGDRPLIWGPWPEPMVSLLG